jgi:hypothetical protein
MTHATNNRRESGHGPMPNYTEYMPTPAERFVEITGVIVLLILLLPIIGLATAELLKERVCATRSPGANE